MSWPSNSALCEVRRLSRPVPDDPLWRGHQGRYKKSQRWRGLPGQPLPGPQIIGPFAVNAWLHYSAHHRPTHRRRAALATPREYPQAHAARAGGRQGPVDAADRATTMGARAWASANSVIVPRVRPVIARRPCRTPLSRQDPAGSAPPPSHAGAVHHPPPRDEQGRGERETSGAGPDIVRRESLFPATADGAVLKPPPRPALASQPGRATTLSHVFLDEWTATGLDCFFRRGDSRGRTREIAVARPDRSPMPVDSTLIPSGCRQWRLVL